MHKFEPPDHSQHLADLLAQLYRLENLVQAGEREEILRLAMDMDWRCLTDEFELVVARHCYDIGYYAGGMIRNLLRPYLQRHDCLALAHSLERLEAALAESPSLHADADRDIAAAWRQQLEGSALRHRPIRDMAPVTTLDGLREAAAAKIALGSALQGSHAPFDGGERVPYADLRQSESRSAAP